MCVPCEAAKERLRAATSLKALLADDPALAPVLKAEFAPKPLPADLIDLAHQLDN